MNMNSKRKEYHGELLELAQAVIEAPVGGQIFMEAKTFNGINSDLVRLHSLLPPMQYSARCMLLTKFFLSAHNLHVLHFGNRPVRTHEMSIGRAASCYCM